MKKFVKLLSKKMSGLFIYHCQCCGISMDVDRLYCSNCRARGDCK